MTDAVSEHQGLEKKKKISYINWEGKIGITCHTIQFDTNDPTSFIYTVQRKPEYVFISTLNHIHSLIKTNSFNCSVMTCALMVEIRATLLIH